jgi:crotonobetainyl-CoA:carnitine CoA-transferase CaiB-like acyl-CoA transferase
LSDLFLNKNTSEWIDIFQPMGLPCAPVNNIKQSFAHPQVSHRKMVESISHPKAGELKVVGIPVKFTETTSSIRLPAPILGQHTKKILGQILGYDEKRIETLFDEGVVE